MKHSRLTLGATKVVCLLALVGGGLASAQTLSPTNGITIGPGSPVFSGGTQTNEVQICLPSGSAGDKIDVFFLMDDTGSFKDWVPTLTNIFSGLVTSLQAAMPGVDFAFGVGRFEDYGGPGALFAGDTFFSDENMRSRPFLLNQAIINATTVGGDATRDSLINAALSHTAAGYGGDAPESSLCEGLFQAATGRGFDGDGNGSMLDSGAAGDLATQISPGTSGDVPPFSSNVLPASGTLGGAGFRSGALRLVILASDFCPVAPFPAGFDIPETITNSSGMAIPTGAFVCTTAVGTSRFGWVSDAKSAAANTVPAAVAPSGSGTVQETINALNALGIRVLCMGPNAAPTSSTEPTSEASTWFSAIARLTGAVDATGIPLVFSTSVGLSNLTDSIVNSISNAVTAPVAITLAASPGLPPGLCFSSVPTVVSNVTPGNCAGFSVSFYGCGDPTAGSFCLNFVAVGSGSVLGCIPVDFVPPTTNPAYCSPVTYTTDADFALGTLFNLNFTNVPNQLQINTGALKTFPIMWIANAGEDSVSKFDTSTGRELARYRTWFGPAGQPGYFNHLNQAWTGAAPSRTAVDRDGNCYVANRHMYDGHPADVLKILATGGIDRNGNHVTDTSVDLDNSGFIDPAEILPMGDANGNGIIDPSEIGDERVAWAVSVGPADGKGRSLAIDGDGNIWLGLYDTKVYYKLSPVDGSILAGPIDVSPNTPYGAQVDGNGILWGASLDGTLLKLDTRAPYAHTVYNHGFGSDYGIAVGNNRVYQANYSGNTYTEFDPLTETFTSPATSRFDAYGIAVDSNGDIFVAKASGGGVVKFRPNGTEIWTAPGQAGTGDGRGCVVDSNNDVWLVHLDTHKISKYRGSDGAPLGVFATGNSPYTYTDATGIGRFNTTAPSGTWTVTRDGGGAGTTWGQISWNGNTPLGTAIKVEARAADVEIELGGRNYTEVANGVSFCDLGIAGQFIEVRATLSRPLDGTESPVLYDITVDCCGVPPTNCVPIVQASEVETNTLRVRQTGLFYQTVSVTNRCGAGISAFRLHLEGLPDDVQVYNASGTLDGVPFLLYNAPVAANGGFEFTIEYYVPNRRTIPNPTFRGEVVPTDELESPAGDVRSTLRVLSFANCAVLVEFSTLSGRTYYVQYASDPSPNAVWKTAEPAIVGNGTSVQWLDSGPPKTESPPCAEAARYYRILLTP